MVGQEIHTLRGRPNTVLAVSDQKVYVSTGRSPGGQPVEIADVQSTVDRVWGGEEVPISPEAVGFRSAFIGAVLGTMSEVEILEDPLRVRLRPQPTPRNPPWEYDELILALDLYLRRGQPSVTDDEVVELSDILNRLPLHANRSATFRNANGVHMKLANFKAVDPDYAGAGLSGGGKRREREVWDRLASDVSERAAAVRRIRAAAGTGPTDAIEAPEDDEAASIEGRILFRLHRVRERDSALVRSKKKSALEQRQLRCEACELDFAEAYGRLGEGYIECHHDVPLGLGAERPTRLDELSLVCANCHRMLHRSKAPLTVPGLRELILLSRADVVPAAP
jgi:5-methylcytosine-specific restriction protein A